MKKVIELTPIKETTRDFELAEKRMKEILKRELYFPILRMLGKAKKTLSNSKESLVESLNAGKITFSKGQFSGRFTSEISKTLKSYGAHWDRKNHVWKISKASLPREIQDAISGSEFRFQDKLKEIDRKLSKMLPEEIAGKVKLEDVFDRALWKTDKEINSTLKHITVAPQLTPERRKRIASEWQNNMQLFIKDFTEKEIIELRKNLKKSVFSGNRFESAVSTIQKSYGVTASKAKFLARQETTLLMTKFKQVRYTDSGVTEYKWGVVNRPKDKSPVQHTPGNVRYYHGLLEGRIFRWDNPPVVDEQGNKKNPGQDYNCRCFARPIVRF